MNTPAEARVDQLASRQAGSVSRTQAVTAGFSDDSIGRRVRSGRWRRVHPGIYAMTSVAPSWLQDVWLAVLAAGQRSVTVQGVAVSHQTALLIHGLDRSWLPPYPISLAVPRGHHRRVQGAVVHQIGDLEPQHLTDVQGLPVTHAARAFIDLSASFGEVHLGRILDELLRSRRVTLPEVSARLGEVARPGKRGITKVAQVLDERGPGHVPSHSELERRLFDAISVAGLPEPVRQHPLPGRHPRNEFVDAAYLDAMIIIEADGRRWHSRISDLKRDHARDAEASQAGWVILRFTYEEITTHPHEVAATIARVRATRLAQLNHVLTQPAEQIRRQAPAHEK